MNVVVFGSTGSVGCLLVEQALAQGHAVTAFARDRVEVDVAHPSLTVVQGDIRDPAAVQRAVQGQDAVLCAIGAGRKGTIRSQGTRHVVNAMEEAGVRRLICLTAIGVGDSRGNLDFFWKHIMRGLFLREAYADHGRQEEHVRGSRLDWTLVRAGAFTDGSRTGRYRHGFPVDDRTIQMKVSRADVADFMLGQLTEDAYLQKAPGVSY